MQSNTVVYSDIFKSFRTKEQVKEFYDRVDEFSNLSFVIDSENVDLLKKTFPLHIAEALYPILYSSEINYKDPMHLKQFLLDLKETVEKAKIADITLGIVPDEELIINLSNHLREALNDSTLLLSVRTDSSIIGGIELIFSGRYWNLGLEKQIDNWFAKKYTSVGNEPSSTHAL